LPLLSSLMHVRRGARRRRLCLHLSFAHCYE
jgi:hypothetical protein